MLAALLLTLALLPSTPLSPCDHPALEMGRRDDGSTRCAGGEENGNGKTGPRRRAAATPLALRLGVLLPMFGLSGLEETWSPLLGVYQAVREINNKTDGVADGLLPGHELRLAFRDSKCDPASSLREALHLLDNAFDGTGVHAIVGAGCSGASAYASRVAASAGTPLVSPTSSSPELSNGVDHPYFARVIPSDEFTAVALVDLLRNMWNYTRVALVHATESYGTGAANAFLESAFAAGLDVGTVLGFATEAEEFSSQLHTLSGTRLRVIVLLCQTNDAARFLRQAYLAGVGGVGYLWLGGDAFASVATSSEWRGDAADTAMREAALRGAFAITPDAAASPRLAAFAERAAALRPTTSGSGGCDLETDDDGNYLWAQDVDDNASTPLRCAGREPRTLDAFAYDAVFAVALGMHELLYVQNRSEVVGEELRDALLTRVAFDGVTGPIDFHDSSKHHGDRRTGFVYTVLNFAADAEPVAVGVWAPCAGGGGACGWGERWSPTGAPLTYSTGTADPPPQAEPEPTDVAEVRLGVLLPVIGRTESDRRGWWPRMGWHQAVAEVNDKADGVADNLLPRTRLVFTSRDSKCDSTAALRGTLSMLSAAFDGKGVQVLLGAGCSVASARAAEMASVLHVPIISPTSTSPELEVHPFFFRVIANDRLRYTAVADVLRHLFNYSTVALVSSTDTFGEGGARAFVTAAEARSINVAAHVEFNPQVPAVEGERQVVSALRASGSRVVVLICHEDDAAELLVDAWRGGVGGEGYLWFGASWSASLWENHATLAAEVPTRDAVLRGAFAMHAGHTASAIHASYAARQAALRPTNGNADRCDNARDDDGIRLWATDHDSDRSTPLVCTGYDPREPSMYDEYAYDAVLAIAHALHELLYVQNRSEVVGEELREALLTRVAFDGATGAVAFSPSGERADPPPPFFLTNYAGTPAGLVHVGTYASCVGRCSWRERWTSTGAALTFASATGRPPAERAAGGGPAATVRLGVLLPMFVWREGGHTPILGSVRHAVFQAIREINNKSDGISDGLLPHTRLVFSYRDSKCDSTHGLTGALALRERAFDGAGVHAIIGAFCSGASATAARVAGATALPIVSPASSSPELSDGRAFPFFLRVAPSDALLASGMADLLLHLWGYRTVALVHSNDPYGTGGADAFLSAALVVGLTVLQVPSFAARATHFVPQQRALRQSGARVVVLFCQSSDGARVLRHALAAGVGGEGYLWLCGDTLATPAMWEDDDQLAASAALREAALRGTFAIAPLAGDASPRLAAFYSRAVAARAAAAVGSSGGGCDLETDDDGNYLWAQDVDDNASTPLRCAGREPEVGNHTFDAFAYDAVFAVAHGVHELLYVQNRSEVVGGELLDALLTRVAFDGATGRVAFHDASDDADLWGHGDRRAGVAYAVLNFASAAAGLVAVGTWAPCASGEGACGWEERWSPTGAPLTYSTGTDPPTQRAGGGWCLANEALTSDGECACADGYERAEEGGAAAECVPCAQLTYSLAGVTEGCTLCAAGAYRPAADLPASECKPCAQLHGAVCGLNATLATLALAHGHWRASPAAVAVVRCEARGGWSPCRGGEGGGGAVEEGEGEQNAVDGEPNDNSAWADAYCAEGHWGPRCELCGSRRAGATYDEYFDAWDAHCRSCDGVPARAAALAGVLLLLAAAAGVLAWLAARGGGGSGGGEGGGSYAAAAVARARRVEAVWRRAALRPKLKAAVGLCQCLSAVQKVYDVAAPDGVGGWTRWLQRAVDLARDAGAGALLPAACYGAYRRRLLIFALWPLALLVLLAAGGLAASGGWRRAKGGLRGGALRCALPPLLVITFLLVPSTSTHIFLTFLCDEVEPRPDAPPLRYLHDDLALSCDSEDYDATRRTALALIAVWPVGVPLLYCALLRAAAPHAAAAGGRRRRRGATPLLRAVAFLTEDYAPSRFWWEPLEMCRKLVLTGWVLLIPEKSEQARVLVAILVSILFLSLHLVAKPHRRPEDGVLMTIVHLTLILVYLCVLVIKTCNASSAACSSFGFGATADGVFTFFLLFGLAMVMVMLAVSAGNLWIESCVPKVILLARAHSVSPSTIMRRVLARRWVDFLRRVRRALHGDTAALTPRFAMSVHRVRAGRGRRPLPHAPDDVAPFVRGELMDLSIDGILPRTRCFVHVDLDAFALRWSSDCFLSLHAVTEVRPAPAADHLGRHRSRERPFPRARRLSHLCRAASSSSAAAATATAAAPFFFSLPASRQSGAAPLPPPSSSPPTTTTTLVVAFLDASGATAALRLHFESAAKAEAWRGGLLRARTLPPRHARDAHTRWALACLAASRGGGGGGDGGGGGGRAALRALLTCANASPKLALADVDAALHAAARDEAAMAWLWGEGGGEGEAWGRGRRPPPARVVAALLLRLSLSTAALRELFCRHAADSARMHADEWREFVCAEQRSPADADAKADADADADADTYAHADADTHAHAKDTEDAEDVEDADFVQFALRLMNRRNDAVAPRRGACGDEGSGGDQHPLAHYWCACSHNSYIVGDQLTGRSTADAYRRQLLQGCRHLEIDCWDGSKSRPVVTHGGTFCTVEQFDEVARAIAECAFVTSELPVMLSLEMHCTPPQQRRLATMCVLHFGRKLLSHDELVASGHATLLSPADLRRRILLKGKVTPPRDTSASAVAPSNEKTTRRRAARARVSLRLSAPWQWKHVKAQVGQLSPVRDTSECASPTRWSRQSNHRHVDVAAAADEASSLRTTHTAPPSRPTGTDEFYESKLALRKSLLSSLLSEVPSANGWIISVSERRHLALLGLSPPERDQIERTAHGSGKGMGMAWGVRVGPAEDSAAEEEEGWGGRGGGGAATTLVRLACDPPPEVGRVQRATAAGWLVRCYPMGLRFSGNNMSPLPCWLSGVGHVALNMSNNDLPVQLHFALFAGTGGYVLKPHGMRETHPHPSQHSPHSPCPPSCDADEYWPPARETVACAAIEILSLHNLPKRGEHRPQYSGRSGVCHQFVPELSGKPSPPDLREPSSPAVTLSLHPIGGFCAVSSKPVVQCRVHTELSTAAVKRNGLCAEFGETFWCFAAEPDATLLHVGVSDEGEAAAYETAVLGRLRRGYRVFRLRSSLGTRIELCCLLVRIEWSTQPNLWSTPRQLRLQQSARHTSKSAKAGDESRATPVAERCDTA